MAKTVLNIAAGKLLPIHDVSLGSHYLFLVNLDPMYYSAYSGVEIENIYNTWGKNKTEILYCDEDANTFMERTKMMFDYISIYRYLEHVSFTEVEYFIYLLSTITEKGADVDIIVPNYEILADMIIADDPESPDFAANNILLTTELLNEPSCPHASIWTIPRAYYFFELEKRFKIIQMEEQFEFDGRDIYMRFIAKRI